MKQKLSILTFCTFLASCCQFEYDDKDFLFNKHEISFFNAYSAGDTIYFENQYGDIDTIEIVEITPTITDPKSACGKGVFMNPRPANSKNIKIKHLPIDKWHVTTQQHFDDGKTKESIDYQTLFSMTKFPLEKELANSITFRDFHSGLALDPTRNDTLILNNQKWSAYFVAEHSYPERVTDSLYIFRVYWTLEDGLIAYENKAGLLWTKK